ncbi:MAG: hypothetical protein KDD69_02355 [Bdellovibrionales bacterium]|nr:hypothetical protein [Bdellovibrionales bacterium]
MTTELDADLLADASENIALLESLLLQYEKVLDVGAEDVSLIHLMFRYAHNAKGAFAILGLADCEHLIHALESNLDSVRTGVRTFSKTLLSLCLAGVGALTAFLEEGDVSNLESITVALQELLAQAELLEQPAANADTLSLDPSALAQLQGLGESGYRLYRIDKAVTKGISRDYYDNLPIFEDVRHIGVLLKVHPSFEELSTELDEQIVQIFFASRESAEDLELHIFDPFKELVPPPMPVVEKRLRTLLWCECEELERQLNAVVGATLDFVPVKTIGTGLVQLASMWEAAEPLHLVVVDSSVLEKQALAVSDLIRRVEARRANGSEELVPILIFDPQCGAEHQREQPDERVRYTGRELSAASLAAALSEMGVQ